MAKAAETASQPTPAEASMFAASFPAVFLFALLASVLAVFAWAAAQRRNEWLLWPLVIGCLFMVLQVVTQLVFLPFDRPNFALAMQVFAGLGVVSGVYVGVLGYRTLVVGKEVLGLKLTQDTALAQDAPTDIRTVSSLLPQGGDDVDPCDDFINGRFVLGRDPSGAPVVWEGNLPHVLVGGTTGAGKGVFLQNLLTQSIANHELLVMIDPKCDEWLPHAVYDACLSASQPYRYLSLLQGAGYQINIVAGASQAEVFEMLVGCMALGDLGKGSDFYKIDDRLGAEHVAELVASQGLTLAKAFQRIRDDEFYQDQAKGFLGKLRELSRIDAINAPEPAWQLSDMVTTGGGVYVLGSMRDPAIKRAQQAIFIRLQQLSEARDRMAGQNKTITIVSDEFKVQVCKPVVEGLATARDKGMRLVIALQSISDLLECPKDLDPAAVMASVIENTACQIVYKLQDPDTAERFAKKSGTIRVQQTTRQVDKGPIWTESATGKTLADGEAHLFDVNKLLSLPKRWAVLFGQGVAQPIRISPMVIEKSPEALQPTAASKGSPETSGASSPVSTDTKSGGDTGADDFFALP